MKAYWHILYTLFLLSSYDLEYSAFVSKSTGCIIMVNRDQNLNVKKELDKNSGSKQSRSTLRYYHSTSQTKEHMVVQMIQALHYKLEGHGFDSSGVTGIFHWHNPSGRKVALVVHMRCASNWANNWKTVWRDWLHLQRPNFQEITSDQNSSECSLNGFHLWSLQNSFTCSADTF
jgi:hypothetical protein